jgi:hypothetical protein
MDKRELSMLRSIYDTKYGEVSQGKLTAEQIELCDSLCKTGLLEWIDTARWDTEYTTSSVSPDVYKITLEGVIRIEETNNADNK